jgi:hypothetical protein
LISKSVLIAQTEATPFFSLPIGWTDRGTGFEGFIQIAVGSTFRVPELNRWRIALEGGFDVKHAYSYISGGAIFYFDDVNKSSKKESQESNEAGRVKKIKKPEKSFSTVDPEEENVSDGSKTE